MKPSFSAMTLFALLPSLAWGVVSGGIGYRVHSGEPQGPVPPRAGAVSDLDRLTSSGPPWKATWELETGYVRMLYNGAGPASTVPVETQARQFLSAHKTLFGLGDVAELRTAAARPGDAGLQARFQQYYKGLRVYPGDVSVSRNKAGQILLVSSGYRPGLSLGTRAAVSKGQAQTFAKTAADGKKASAPELIVWAVSRPFKLAWQVDVDVRPDRNFRVILDAATGRVIEKFNRVSRSASSANVYLGNSVSTPQAKTVELPNLDGSGTLTGQFVTVNKFKNFDAQGNPVGAIDLHASGEDGFKLASTAPQFNQTSMYYHVNRMHDYFKGTFNFTAWDKSMPAYVDVVNADGSALNNAYFSPASNSITFGSLGTGQDLALDGDVIGHEYTHAVVNTLNQIGNNGRWTEARAMNEAIADYFSATTQGEGCMGEYATGKTDGSCGRDLTNRRAYPDEVPEKIDLKDGSSIYAFPEEHYTGQIWGAALWDLRRALGGPLADKIIFASLPKYPATATFSDARVALQAADAELGTGKLEVIKTVMQNRGIPEQALAPYAEPFFFSPSQQQTICTAFLSPEGGPFDTNGFLPVFVQGRTYVLLGFTDIPDVKDIILVFLDGNQQLVKAFGANLSDVKVTVQSGQVPVKRFQINAQIPADLTGNYKVALGYSTDGQNIQVNTPLDGRVIASTPAAPAPPGEVVTPPSDPNAGGGTPPPDPVVPATLQVDPPAAEVFVGEEKEFKATVIDTQNKVIPNAPVNWSVEGADPNVGTVSANGIFTAKSVGSVTLVGKVNAVEGRATVTVKPAFTPPNVNTWQQIGNSETVHILGLSASGAGGSTTLYGAGEEGLGVSVNRQPFADIGNGVDPNSLPYAVAANPKNPQIAYLGTLYGGLYKTENGGQSWAQYAQDLMNPFASPPFPAVSSVVTDEQDEVLIGTLNAGAFFRAGANQPWQPANVGLTTATIYTILFTNTALFAGTNNGVFRATGGPWGPASNGLNGGDFEGSNLGFPPTVTQLAVDPQNPQRLLAGTFEDGTFLSENNGDTWKHIPNGLESPSVLTVAIDPVKPSRFFAGTDGAGVFVSNDGGTTWEAARGGLNSGVITSLVFDPVNPNLLYAGTYGDGVWFLDLNGEIVSEGIARSAQKGYGDVNADTQVDVTDAVMVLQSVVGLVTLGEGQKDAADVNRDKTVDVGDAVLVLRKAVGLDP